MRLILLIIFIALSGCSEFLILSSGTTAIVSQNTLSKAYNGIDMMTTIQTEKNIKGHLLEKIKKDKK
jgi:uncharacterized protein YceK